MGLNFRRSIKIGKNTRLNFSKSGIGISTGVKGARISIGPRGIRKTVGIPGTGIFYTKQSSLGKFQNDRVSSSKVSYKPTLNTYNTVPTKGTIMIGNKNFKPKTLKKLSTFLIWVGIFLILVSLFTMPVGILFLIIGIVEIATGTSYRMKIKEFNNTNNNDSLQPILNDWSQEKWSTNAPQITDIPSTATSKPKTIHTKVAGVTYGDRQEYLSECFVEQDLLIKNKPIKNYPHAMAVYTLSDDDEPDNIDKPRKVDKLLGYLNDDLAKELYEQSMRYVFDDEKPEPYDAWIVELTGGTEEKPTRGCNIEIIL